MLPFSQPSCYSKPRPPSCALGTSFYTVSEGPDLMMYVSDNYTSYSAPSRLNYGELEKLCNKAIYLFCSNSAYMELNYDLVKWLLLDSKNVRRDYMFYCRTNEPSKYLLLILLLIERQRTSQLQLL